MTLGALAVLAILALAVGARAETVDLERALVGTWHGDIRLRSAVSPHRTLIVERVDTVQGVFHGRYGVTGKRLSVVDGRIERIGESIVLRFASPTRGQAVLRLEQESLLAGDYHLREGSGIARTVGLPMRLVREPPAR